jgi:hypothetical protein
VTGCAVLPAAVPIVVIPGNPPIEVNDPCAPTRTAFGQHKPSLRPGRQPLNGHSPDTTTTVA